MLNRLFASIILMVLAVSPAAAATTWSAYVVRVEDGNTVSVSTDKDSEEPEKVLVFYGIEAPSLRQPYGPQALAYLQRMMPAGSKVDVEDVGQLEAGPITALVQVGGDSVNYKLVIISCVGAMLFLLNLVGVASLSLEVGATILVLVLVAVIVLPAMIRKYMINA